MNHKHAFGALAAGGLVAAFLVGGGWTSTAETVSTAFSVVGDMNEEALSEVMLKDADRMLSYDAEKKLMELRGPSLAQFRAEPSRLIKHDELGFMYEFDPARIQSTWGRIIIDSESGMLDIANLSSWDSLWMDFGGEDIVKRDGRWFFIVNGTSEITFLHDGQTRKARTVFNEEIPEVPDKVDCAQRDETPWVVHYPSDKLHQQGDQILFELSDDDCCFGLHYDLGPGTTPALYGEWSFSAGRERLHRDLNGQWYYLLEPEEITYKGEELFLTLDAKGFREKEGGSLSPDSVDREDRLRLMIARLDKGDLGYGYQELPLLRTTTNNLPLHSNYRLALQALGALGRAEKAAGISASSEESKFRYAIANMFTRMDMAMFHFDMKVASYLSIKARGLPEEIGSRDRQNYELATLAQAALKEFGQDAIPVLIALARKEVKFGCDYGCWADDSSNVFSLLQLIKDDAGAFLPQMIELAKYAEDNPYESSSLRPWIIGKSYISSLVVDLGYCDLEALRLALSDSGLAPDGKIMESINRRIKWRKESEAKNKLAAS